MISWDWQFWGVEIGEEPPPILLYAIPAEQFTEEQAIAEYHALVQKGCQEAQLRKVLIEREGAS